MIYKGPFQPKPLCQPSNLVDSVLKLSKTKGLQVLTGKTDIYLVSNKKQL